MPNEPVWLKSSFALSLPVSDGVYSRDFTGIHLPAGNKSLFLTAEDVKDIKIIGSVSSSVKIHLQRI